MQPPHGTGDFIGVTGGGVEDLPSEPVGAMSARSLLRLPAEERERLLVQAAALVMDEYEDGGSLAGFEAMSWEDHVDASLGDE